MPEGYSVSIQVEDDWVNARTVTTFESGDLYERPITAALLFGKDENGGLTVALATDRREAWDVETITLALQAWAQDYASNPSYYSPEGQQEP